VAPPASSSFAGGAGYVERERAGRREGVWELAGNGVRSIVCSEGAFIGQEVGGEGGQKVAGAGALATSTGNTGCGGLASVLAGFCRGVGALWAGVGETTPVGSLQRGRGREEGVRAVSSFSFPVSRPGSGLGRLGSTEGVSTAWLQGLGRTRTASSTVNVVFFPKFCPPGARHNARKN
jgi:hypothetical protein